MYVCQARVWFELLIDLAREYNHSMTRYHLVNTNWLKIFLVPFVRLQRCLERKDKAFKHLIWHYEITHGERYFALPFNNITHWNKTRHWDGGRLWVQTQANGYKCNCKICFEPTSYLQMFNVNCLDDMIFHHSIGKPHCQAGNWPMSHWLL